MHAVILGVHHMMVTIPMGAEAEARRFYCGVLGFAEIEKPPSLAIKGGLWLQCGDRQLHIGPESGVERSATRAHLAYEVTDLAHWRAIVLREGLAVLESIPIPGYDRFECRDPFGNRMEFIQPIAAV